MSFLTAGIGNAAIQVDGFRFVAGDLRLAGDATIMNDVLRLTPAKPDRAGAAWFGVKQPIASGFETTFQFRLTQQGGLGHGADGFAFVLQNAGPTALGGRGSAGGFAFSDTQYRKRETAIPWSIAVFFDTFKNGGKSQDPSDNYVGIFTGGRPGDLRWPAPRLAVVPSLPVYLRDQKPHTVRIRFRPPQLDVYLDDLSTPVLTSLIDLSIVIDPQGTAWVGFTASTGGGYQNHEILNWSFATENVSSNMSVVSSQITFQVSGCLPDRKLCTPQSVVVEAAGAGYRIVLPANLEWGAAIPNPAEHAVVLSDKHGIVCWNEDTAGRQECSGSDGIKVRGDSSETHRDLLLPDQPAGALIMKTRDGRTWFSVNGHSGAMNANEGFFEFHVELKETDAITHPQ
jgi:hypothetical protein